MPQNNASPKKRPAVARRGFPITPIFTLGHYAATEQHPARKSRMSPKVGRDLIAKLRAGKWYSAKTLAEDAGIYTVAA